MRADWDRVSIRFSRSRTRNSSNLASCSASRKVARVSSIFRPRVVRSSRMGIVSFAAALLSSISLRICACWSEASPSASASRNILASSRVFGPWAARSVSGKSPAFTSVGRRSLIEDERGRLELPRSDFLGPAFDSAAGVLAGGGDEGLAIQAMENPMAAAMAGRRTWDFMRCEWR